MLYDFHHNENNKKTNSVNATYILTGVQKAPEPTSATNGVQDSFDESNGIPQSSPYVSSSMPNQDAVADDIAISSVLLVREEDLEGTLFHCIGIVQRMNPFNTTRRCQIDIPSYFIDICLQSSTYRASGSQCLDGCGWGNGGQPCPGRSLGVRHILGYDSG